MRVLIASFILATSLFSYEDLGTYGQTKEIKERDLMELFNERASQLDYKKVEEEIISNAKKSLIIKSSIPACTENKQRVYEPLVKVNQDIKIPYTDVVLHKKGSSYNILKENRLFMPYNMMFIDADDEVQVELAKVYKMELGYKLRVFAVKGNLFKLLKDPILKESQMAREDLEVKAFDLKCVPSIYAQKEYKFNIVEYSPELIKKDEENEK